MAKESPTKVILITGSNRGIGLELVRQLAAEDWQIIATSRTKPSPDSATKELIDRYSNIRWMPLDISQTSSIEQLASTLEKESTTIDVLINNAGILLDWHDSILNVDIQTIRDTLNTNTIGPILVTRGLLPHLKRSEDPLVINVSSAAGSLTDMRDWAPAYSISKTALNAATRQFALALEPEGISVCCISPGWVRTDMGGSNATRTAEDSVKEIRKLLTHPPKSLNARFLRDTKDIPW